MNKTWVTLAIASLLIFSCNEKNEVVDSPPGYNLAKPIKHILPDVLLEVSGIAFHEGNNDTIYAQQDEDGKVFYLKLGEKKVRSGKFSKKGDYEDISIMRDQVFLLRSYGTIFSFPFPASKESDIEGVKEWVGLLPDGEFEGMYADPATGNIYVLCKQCSSDKGTPTTSGYILGWDGDTALVRKGEFTLDTRSIVSLQKQKKSRFQPSALAIHPLTGQWYIVSSVNKLLVVAEKDWTIQASYPLDPGRFRQPEGIAFDKSGNLYISNEGDEITNGNVLQFNYTPTK